MASKGSNPPEGESVWRSIAWHSWRVARLEKACGLKWNANSPLAFYSESFSERIMYPWPIGDFDYAMDVALDTRDELSRAHRAGEKVRRGAACGGNCDCNSLENGRTAPASAGRYRRGTEDAAFIARSKARLMMKYRDVEYTVVQGIERGLWKWSASVAGVALTGQAAIKSEAAAGAERAIDRALAPKKVRIVPPAD